MSNEQHNLPDEYESTSQSRRVRNVLPNLRLTARESVMLAIAAVLGVFWLADVFAPRGPSGFVSSGNPSALIKQAPDADKLVEQTTKESITAFEQWAYLEFCLPSDAVALRSTLVRDFRDIAAADLQNRSCRINGRGSTGTAKDLYGFSLSYESGTARGGIEVDAHTMPDGSTVLICFAWEHVK